MKKDISIPKVDGVTVAAVQEYNDTDKTNDWYVYLINEKDNNLEMVVVVSQGFSATKTTSIFRKKIEKLPANSFAKIELIHPDVFALQNRFQVTFFEENQLFEKTFFFEANTIKEGALRMLKQIDKRGVLASS